MRLCNGWRAPQAMTTSISPQISGYASSIAMLSMLHRLRGNASRYLIPRYHAKAASLVLALQDQGENEAEAYYENQAQKFEAQRDCLLQLLRESDHHH